MFTAYTASRERRVRSCPGRHEICGHQAEEKRHTVSDTKILIIEDNPLNMELAIDLLEAVGYVVVGAVSAEEGIQRARSERPCLILMDIALPGMDGLMATEILKTDPRTSGIPVVALTAQAMKGDRDLALAAGCADYITKPIDTRTFARTVSEYLYTGAALEPEKAA